MDLESRTKKPSFHQANTKRPEEITLREDVTSWRSNAWNTIDDFGLCLYNNDDYNNNNG